MTPRRISLSPRAATLFLVLAAGLLLAQEALFKNYLFCPGHFPPPHEQQMQSLLRGGEARPLPGERFRCSAGVELDTFLKTGETNLVVQTPECIVDQRRKAVNSSGPLKVQTAGSRFLIEGTGFLWRQANSSLIISNDVHTVVQPDMLASASTNRNPHGVGVSPAPFSATSPSIAAEKVRTDPDAPAEPVDIRSRRFDYSADSGLGVYSGNVRVSGKNLALKSGSLEIKVPYKQGQVQRITAKQKVRIDYGGIRGLGRVQATGAQADYLTGSGLITLTGSPAWRAGQREGRGDTLVIDQTNKVFRSEGHAWLKMPGQSARESGFFGQFQAPPSGSAPTNEFIEVSSDHYDVWTNSALFTGHVQISHLVGGALEGKMTCGTLSLSFSGTNQLRSMTAEKDVVIQQFDKQTERRFTGGRLDFDAPSGLLTLTDHPTWRVGEREGRGDVMEANVRQDVTTVRGHAWMRLPAGELRQSSALPGRAAARLNSATNQFAQVFCKEYRVTRSSALFSGGVRIEHPQMTWTSPSISVEFPPGGGRADRMVAEPQVDFYVLNQGKMVHGTGQKAVYTYSISPNATNELMQLLGNPATLEVTNTGAFLTNQVIIWDLISDKMFLPPGYHIYVPQQPAGVTNGLFGK
jgi:lipopolysaccharide export system protein LptA